MNLFIVMLLSIQLFQTDLHIGVVDRIEGEKVVILIEAIGEEVILDKNKELKEDKWFLIYWRDNKPLILSPLPALESERGNQTKQLLEQLRGKQPAYYPSINAPIAPA